MALDDDLVTYFGANWNLTPAPKMFTSEFKGRGVTYKSGPYSLKFSVREDAPMIPLTTDGSWYSDTQPIRIETINYSGADASAIRAEILRLLQAYSLTLTNSFIVITRKGNSKRLKRRNVIVTANKITADDVTS